MPNPTTTVTSTWSTTADLPIPGSLAGQHDGPALLPDGTVLVAGGGDATSAALARAARYDPTAGHWKATGAMHAARRLHSVTVLADGGVLVAGGTSAGSQFPPSALATAEVYAPTTGTWTGTDDLQVARWDHSAVALPDGSVLVAGGTAVRSGQSVRALASVERWDPTTGKWTSVAPMTDARTGHPAVLLDNGHVLVVGGSVPTGRDSAADLAFCELYDPATDTWTPTGNMTVARAGHRAVAVSPTSVLVTGGRPPGRGGDGTFDPFSRATAELYNQGTGAWTAVAAMPAGRQLHRAVTLVGGRVLLVGGTDGGANAVGYASAIEYDPIANIWTEVGGLAAGRWSFGAVALTDHTVLVTGGIGRAGLAAAGAPELTAGTEIFTAGPDTP
ncbi:Kelch-like protein 17 [Pseudonocardia sp. RS11V-5]|uniref:Kelch repeat-containing protein n=1 Tax=Pseudonocardia terrae TaxID=2905831 RepID=UPI001E4EEFF4|nr:kelch repeat-containing protein [Pseudonocardia terrae]MCE3555574.1 Kelch-like protein 17 [Pseudonocardia terrae]